MNAPAAGGAPLIYLSSSTLPSQEANAVHVAHMCEAFAAQGRLLHLRARRGDSELSLRDYYGLARDIPVRYETHRSHKLWRLARRLDPRRRPPPIYYGRRVAAVNWLAALGYAVMVELHVIPQGKQLQRMERIVDAKGFLGVVVISERLKQALLECLPRLQSEAVLVAHDGVAADRFCPPVEPRSGPPRVVYCGSLHCGKGIESLLAVASQLPELPFEVYGGSPAQVEQFSAGAPANVRFHGHLPHVEVPRRLREADIAVAPYGSFVRGARSRADAPNLADWMSPLKVFEYTAAGLPIVTSDLPVLRELLQPDRSALLVPPGDNRALADALRRLAADPALRRQLVGEAQRDLREHTWERRAQRIGAFVDWRLTRLQSARAR
jgi:glycosyltransferase involved in cell wall biosynthesis